MPSQIYRRFEGTWIERKIQKDATGYRYINLEISNKLSFPIESVVTRKNKCKYIQLNVKMDEEPARIFIIKYGRNTNWKVLLTTDTSMHFVRAFELYERR